MPSSYSRILPSSPPPASIVSTPPSTDHVVDDSITEEQLMKITAEKVANDISSLDNVIKDFFTVYEFTTAYNHCSDLLSQITANNNINENSKLNVFKNFYSSLKKTQLPLDGREMVMSNIIVNFNNKYNYGEAFLKGVKTEIEKEIKDEVNKIEKTLSIEEKKEITKQITDKHNAFLFGLIFKSIVDAKILSLLSNDELQSFQDYICESLTNKMDSASPDLQGFNAKAEIILSFIEIDKKSRETRELTLHP
jgi:hypothetical protein